MNRKSSRITRFKLPAGKVLAGKYEVVARLGAGWEGEVYLVREKGTGIERTAKIFFPQRNPSDRALRFYARKLHKLRQCPILIQYHTQDHFDYRDLEVSFLVSEFIDGELLSDFIKRQSGQRLASFPGLHLLHALATGIEQIHLRGEYHGDLHADNVIVTRYGLTFDLKLLDMYHWGAPNADNIRHDVFDLVRIFYDALGGPKHYAKQPQPVKDICRGLKRGLIAKEFRSAGKLRQHLENLEW